MEIISGSEDEGMAEDSQVSGTIDLCEIENYVEAGAVKLGLGGVHGGSRLSRLHASQSQMARCRPVGQSVSCSLSLSLTLSVSISPLSPLDLEVLSDCEDTAVTCKYSLCAIGCDCDCLAV